MHSIDIQGIPIYYTVQGQGAPLILMHGWGCNHSTVASIAKIAQKHCTVYNVDLPGFGKTPEPNETWGVDEYTAAIESFTKSLGITRPILIGHSYGGRIGLLYASRNDVSKLILIDAAGIKPKRSIKYYIKIYSYKLTKRLYHTIYGKKRAEEKIEAIRKAKSSADYAAASPRMRAILSRSVNQDLKHVMHKIAAPTLLIWGEDDTATPLSDAKTMEKLIPDAGLVSFPGCGHYSFLDNPVQFAAVITSFLKSDI